MLAGVVLALGAAVGVSSHYTFPKVNGGGDWQHVRRADNWQNNGFVGNVNSDQIRCFQSTHQGAQATLNVTAGSTVTYGAAPNVYHPGPMSFYLARVPDGQDVSSWKGEGNVWFKIYQEQPSGGNWPSNGKTSFQAKIPSCIKSGYYLLRAEHLGLHSAGSAGGAQFYISCAQLGVTGGGNVDPPNKVSFPGAYKSSDPGIQINIYNPPLSKYTNPGPSVFSC
ncbi:magnesium-bound glycoside hydrolase 61 isoform E from Thiela Terrestris [Cercophora newfieldiana]|uniref:lytic cellulose monooxygenase (C4-dehydrogenating) n=1 Tax=Cercophora newfieldiana TaxID=92897 RepID=A0AA39YED9_9PEZI|nr:magnesium-bound glycoside hydrolase 61 isoform E from Thiela Terrestris [Cercophora newfieldiana]